MRKVVLHLIAGRRIVGYHITQKLKELQIVAETLSITQQYGSFSQSELCNQADENEEAMSQFPHRGFFFDAAHAFTSLSEDDDVLTVAKAMEQTGKMVQSQLPFDQVC